MQIFITGATGFIGGQLARKLLRMGHTLHLIHREQSPMPAFATHPRVRLFKGDLLDPISLQGAMAGCEQVYHLAAYAKSWAKQESVYEAVNVTGTEYVLRAALAQGVQKLVFTSTAGTLGPSDHFPMDEFRPRKVPFFNPYERTKFRAEEVVQAYADKGLPSVIVNPPRVFGPGVMNESNAATRLIALYLSGRWRIILGNGSGVGNYAFVDDVVQGHMLAMQYGKTGERYILGGTNLSLKTYLDLVAELSGKHYHLFAIPMPVAIGFARWEAFRAKYFQHYPLITPSWLEKYKYNWALTSRKAERELGYTITPVREALQLTIEALRNPGSLKEQVPAS